MQFKRYDVMNLQDAVIKIKKDLGPDAIILSTKKKAPGSPLIEVIAARDERTESAYSAPGHIREERQDEVIDCLRREFGELKSHLNDLTKRIASQKDILDIKETMNVLFDHMAIKNAAHLRAIYTTLITNGIPRSKAIRLIETIKDEFPPEARDTYEKGINLTETLIARSFTKDKGKGRRIMALIGPTGVGKTTTVAKLAAHYSLDKKLKVGLITTDTYRIGAAEQLKIYAKIMGLPLLVASEKSVFLDSVESFAEKDVILVDTPGRNHNDEKSLQSLKTVLDPTVEAILLLSPVANREYLMETADRFRMFNYNRIILSKVDECNRFGAVYDILGEIDKPVSYMTTGQNVPRDIEAASPDRLAQLIVNNRLN